MELRLPLVVVESGHRSYRGWVPHFPSLRAQAPTLAELRDEVALRVMEAVESSRPADVAAYDAAPHLELRHVRVDTVVLDPEKKRRIELRARMGVLLEKWPDDRFIVATPTRLPLAQFALHRSELLNAALTARLQELAIAEAWTGIDAYHVEEHENVELLEVDVYPPSILPSRPRPLQRKRSETGPISPEREKERNRLRLQARELRVVGQNLTYLARDGALVRAYGRKTVVEELLEAFRNREGTQVVLLGPSGSGKTAVIHEVVRRLVEEEGAAHRRDVWRVDGNRFIAGMSYVGQWEARAKKVAEELSGLGDILYVDDLLSLAHAGRTRSESTNVAQYLEPHLRRGELTVLAESTEERFSRLREELPSFAALFHAVHLSELDRVGTLPVLLGSVRRLEQEVQVGGVPLSVTPSAIEAILALSERFSAGCVLPGRAVRLLAEISGTVAGLQTPKLTADDVYAGFQMLSGLPDSVVRPDRARSEPEIRDYFVERIAGQPEAVSSMVELLLTVQGALADPTKPLATMLFVGPTGVGKTETAKALAGYLFGESARLVRFDMSEFASPASIARFVGSAGAAEGELTLALRSTPFAVILLDEVEKAHPRVFDALLQLLGEGRLTDATGRTVDARQTVILMTSNLGVRDAAARVGFGSEQVSQERNHYLTQVRQFFRPEFFNRIDRIVGFRSLDPAALRRVVQHALDGLLARRGLREARVLVDVDDDLLDTLVKEAADPRYGARPLRRALEKRVTVPLAHHLVSRSAKDYTFLDLYPAAGDLGLGVEPLLWQERFPENAALRLARSPESLIIEHERLLACLAEAEIGEQRAELADLLFQREELQEALQSIDVTTLEQVQFEEEFLVDNLPIQVENVNRQHAKPRPGYIERPVRYNREPAAQQLYPELANLRDRVEILEHQLARAREGSQETWTLVVRFETHTESGVALNTLLECLPNLGHLVFSDEQGETISHPDLSAKLATGKSTRGFGVTYCGYGLQELLQPFAGLLLVRGLPLPGDTCMAEVALFPGEAKQAVERANHLARERARIRRAAAPGATSPADWAAGESAIAPGITPLRRIVWELDRSDPQLGLDHRGVLRERQNTGAVPQHPLRWTEIAAAGIRTLPSHPAS